MKTFLIALIIFISSGENNLKIKNVYICDSAQALVYHKTKDCEGLRNCLHEIKMISMDEAKHTYNRRPCKVCYFWSF